MGEYINEAHSQECQLRYITAEEAQRRDYGCTCTPEKRVESGEQNPKSGGVNDLRTDSVTGGAAFPTNETPHCTCTPYKDSKCIFHSPQPPAPDWAEQGMTKRKCVRCGRKILLSEHSNVRYCSERCSRAAGEGR